MKLLRLNDSGSDVKYLQEQLNSHNYKISIDGVFGPATDTAVRDYQRKCKLTVDGLVGFRTWEMLLFSTSTSGSKKIRDVDYKKAAYLLSCEEAAIRAVEEVETSGKGGFLVDGKPVILFEGHIFWRLLKASGRNPETFQKGNEDILYPKWTKSHYKGGSAEYTRLNKARRINRSLADEATSWGMFQILGNNYKSCYCDNVNTFVNISSISETSQLRLFIRFIYYNKLGVYLQKKNWTEFARRYNGPGYAENSYHTKLATAYRKYSR